jgi:hypothetical protein
MALRRSPQHVPLLGLLTILAFSGFAGSAFAASRAGSPTADPRIVDAVDETKLVTLGGRTHPLAAPKYDQGAVSDSFPMEAYVPATAAQLGAGRHLTTHD